MSWAASPLLLEAKSAKPTDLEGVAMEPKVGPVVLLVADAVAVVVVVAVLPFWPPKVADVSKLKAVEERKGEMKRVYTFTFVLSG